MDDEGQGLPAGRRRKMFDAAQFQLLILSLVSEQPRHGYEIIRAVEERSGGVYAPSPGMVYPTLTLLFEMDLIAEVASQGGRKSFLITDAGRDALRGKGAEIARLFERLAALGSQRDRPESEVLHRAMGNLRQVLVSASQAGRMDPGRAEAAARHINEAARCIAQLLDEGDRNDDS